MVIEGAFSAVKSVPPHDVRVLAPSVGAGVFLVLALRRLVAEHWLHKGVRPTRQMIRRLLANQLSGFDINLDALNIAALSLYLAALELDPKPSPLTDLKFKKLIGSVLRLVDNDALGNQTDLGSLSQPIIQGFRGRYDIVVGNPPWTGFKGPAAKLLNGALAQLISHTGNMADEAGNVTARRSFAPTRCPVAEVSGSVGCRHARVVGCINTVGGGDVAAMCAMQALSR